jgi:DNA-directed RNA polymerase III subunit RPC8
MFIISELQDKVRVQPQDLSRTPEDAVTAVIEQQYLDKVIPNLGLVVTVYDVLSIEGGLVYPNNGAAFFDVTFRLVVFRPFVGEVLVGRLKSCDRCAHSSSRASAAVAAYVVSSANY